MPAIDPHSSKSVYAANILVILRKYSLPWKYLQTYGFNKRSFPQNDESIFHMDFGTYSMQSKLSSRQLSMNYYKMITDQFCAQSISLEHGTFDGFT